MKTQNRYYEIPLVPNSTDYSVPHLFSNDSSLYAIYEFKIPDLDHDGIFHEVLQEVRHVQPVCVVYAFDGYQFEYLPAEINEEITGHARLFNFKLETLYESEWLDEMRMELMSTRGQTIEETQSYRHYRIQYNSGILNVCARTYENERIKGSLYDYMHKHKRPIQHLKHYFD